MNNEIPVKEIGELLDSVTSKVPKLISGLMDTVYSADAGTKMGQSVGNFYKELIESGIPKEDAMQMTKSYMLSVKDIIGNAASGATSNPGEKKSGFVFHSSTDN